MTISLHSTRVPTAREIALQEALDLCLATLSSKKRHHVAAVLQHRVDMAATIRSSNVVPIRGPRPGSPEAIFLTEYFAERAQIAAALGKAAD